MAAQMPALPDIGQEVRHGEYRDGEGHIVEHGEDWHGDDRGACASGSFDNAAPGECEGGNEEGGDVHRSAALIAAFLKACGAGIVQSL